MTLSADLAAILYTVSAVLFILALRGLSSPETSRRGNLYGMVGIAIAIMTTILVAGLGGEGLLLAGGGLAVGGVIGAIIAKKIPMTDMPQLVAAFHSLVGLAAVLVAVAAFALGIEFALGLWIGKDFAFSATLILSFAAVLFYQCAAIPLAAVTMTGRLLAYAAATYAAGAVLAIGLIASLLPARRAEQVTAVVTEE